MRHRTTTLDSLARRPTLRRQPDHGATSVQVFQLDLFEFVLASVGQISPFLRVESTEGSRPATARTGSIPAGGMVWKSVRSLNDLANSRSHAPADPLDPPPERCDLLVVGAGILGLATARELALRHPG